MAAWRPRNRRGEGRQERTRGHVHVRVGSIWSSRVQKIALSGATEIRSSTPRGRDLEKYIPQRRRPERSTTARCRPRRPCSASGPAHYPDPRRGPAAMSATKDICPRTRRCGYEIDPSGHTRRPTSSTRASCTRRSSRNNAGKILDYYNIPTGRHRGRRWVDDHPAVARCFAKTPVARSAATADITGGSRASTALFDARTQDPAVNRRDRRPRRAARREARRARTIIVKKRAGSKVASTSSRTRKHLRVHVVDPRPRRRPLVLLAVSRRHPPDLREEAPVQRIPPRDPDSPPRAQRSYRRQAPGDHHRQMLLTVRIESVGDTGLLSGSALSTSSIRGKNQELMAFVEIKDPGETASQPGRLVPLDHFRQENLRFDHSSAASLSGSAPSLLCEHELLGSPSGVSSPTASISGRELPGDETKVPSPLRPLAGNVGCTSSPEGERDPRAPWSPSGNGFKSHQGGRGSASAPEARGRYRPRPLTPPTRPRRCHPRHALQDSG